MTLPARLLLLAWLATSSSCWAQRVDEVRFETDLLEVIAGRDIQVALTADVRLACGAPEVQRRGPRDVLVTLGAGELASPGCPRQNRFSIGPFDPGMLTMTVRLLLVTGAMVDSVHTVEVFPLAGRCSRDPENNARGLVVDPRDTPQALAARVASDAAYAERLGDPLVTVAGTDPYWQVLFGYPPLVDPIAEAARLLATNEFRSAFTQFRSCFFPPGPDTVADMVEFHHNALDQYFYSANATEIAAIERGVVATGWMRTGQQFAVVSEPFCPFNGGVTPVYRFTAAPGGATGAHVFTRERAECGAIRDGGQWIFEGVPFWAAQPLQDGTCRPGRQPLMRLWRPFGPSTHRFTTSSAVVEEMRAKGWIAEGTVMCVQA